MARSLNKATLIGNLTRDPELRFTPQGNAVCTFGVATNRQWVTEGEKKEDVEFHRVVAWNKLAEICGQLLAKGRKVYVEGRLKTRSWTGQDGNERQTTEIVINEMIVLDSKGVPTGKASVSEDFDIPEEMMGMEEAPPKEKKKEKKTSKSSKKKEKKEKGDDIPF